MPNKHKKKTPAIAVAEVSERKISVMAIIALAQEHINRQHGDSDGWITLARKENGQWIQDHFKPEKIETVLSEWIGDDVYFSQNTFYQRRRRVEDVRQLRALYVDVDCYNFNYMPEWVIGKMELELFGQTVPEPNLIIHSGRGFNLIWQIDPVPGKKALPLWQAVENYLSSQFKDFGGDTKATDAARVFRIAGSINSKSGEHVMVQYRHSNRYTLRQIQNDYLPELKPKTKIKGRPKPLVNMFNLYTLHYTRLMDLRKLVALRNYDCKGYRECICFLYRYWTCCFMKDDSEALQAMLDLNSEFKQPLPDREVITATRNAEAAAHDKKYKLSNERLIEWLNITEDEQRHMKTIIGKDVKRQRNTEAKRLKRGSVTRGEYLTAAAERRSEALRMRKEGMSLRQIAKALGVSPEGVRKMLV